MKRGSRKVVKREREEKERKGEGKKERKGDRGYM